MKHPVREIGAPGDDWRVINSTTSIVINDELTGRPGIVVIRDVIAGSETGEQVRKELGKIFTEIAGERKDVRVCGHIHIDTSTPHL